MAMQKLGRLKQCGLNVGLIRKRQNISETTMATNGIPHGIIGIIQ